MDFKRKSASTNQSSARKLQKVTTRRSAFSYYSDRSQNYEPNQAVARKAASKSKASGHIRRWFNQLPVIFAIVLIIAGMIYELGLNSTPKVVILGDMSAAQNLFIKPTTVYQQAAQKFFGSSLSNRNKFTVNTTAIATNMQQHFPELASVSVTLPLIGHEPILYIEPARPEVVLDSPDFGLFLIDTNGKVLTKIINTQISKINTLPIVTDQSNITVEPGKDVLPETDVTFIQLAVAQLQAQHIAVKSIIVPAASRELDIYINGISYFVKFNLNDSSDSKQQIGTYLAVRQYLISHNITPSQYIDARVLGRVYYK